MSRNLAEMAARKQGAVQTSHRNLATLASRPAVSLPTMKPETTGSPALPQEQRLQLPTLKGWATNVGAGTAKQSASSYGNAMATLYAAGQGRRDQMNDAFLADHKAKRDRAQRDLNMMLEDNRKAPGTWTDRDMQAMRNIIRDEDRKVGAMRTVTTQQVQRHATAQAQEGVDALAESGGRDIETAREMAGQKFGKAGRFATDVAAAGLGMVGDVAVSAATLGIPTAAVAGKKNILARIAAAPAMPTMAFRGFGGGAQEARRGGGDLKDQLVYGLGSAAVSVATEKLSNATKPFAKMFGKGVADDLVENAIGKAVERAARTAVGKTALDGILRTGAGFVGEGFEEFLEDVASPILKRATYDPEARFELQEAVYDFLVGGTLGAVGGAVDAAGGAKGRYQDYGQQAKNQSIDRAYDVMKDKGMFSREGRNAMRQAIGGLKMPKLKTAAELSDTDVRKMTEPVERLKMPTLEDILDEYGGERRAEPVVNVAREKAPVSAADKIARGVMPTNAELKRLNLEDPAVRNMLEQAGVEVPAYGSLGTIKERIRAAVEKNQGKNIDITPKLQQRQTGDMDSQVDEILREYRQDGTKESTREQQDRNWVDGQWIKRNGQWQYVPPHVEETGTEAPGQERMTLKRATLEKPAEDVEAPMDGPEGRADFPNLNRLAEEQRQEATAEPERAEDRAAAAENEAREVSGTYAPGERSGETETYSWHMENHRYGPYYEITIRNKKTGEITRRSGDLRREKPQKLLYEMVHEDASKARAAEVTNRNVGENPVEGVENAQEATGEPEQQKKEPGDTWEPGKSPEADDLHNDLERMPEKLRAVGVAPYRTVGNYDGVDFLAAQVKGMKSMRRKVQKIIREFGTDSKTRKFAQDVAAGTLTMDDVPATVNRHDVATLADYYRAMNSGSDAETLAMRRRRILENIGKDMEALLGMDVSYEPIGLERGRVNIEGHGKATDAINSVLDKTRQTFSTFRRNTMTPARIAVKEFGREHGRKVYDYFFRPVVENNGRQVDWVNSMLDKVRTFQDSKGNQRKLNAAERAYVMALVENGAAAEQVAHFDRQYQGAVENVRNGWDVKKAADEFGIKDFSREYKDLVAYKELLDTQKNLETDHDVDPEICNTAAKAYSQMYEQLYDAINEFLVAHGYETIGFIKGYAPHLQPEEVKSPLKSVMKLMGMDDKAMDLPTSIAGQTADLKPYKQYDPFFQERTSKEADYNKDVVQGFESYVQYLGNIFYHTDDIMRLRAASQYLRKTYATEEASEQLGWAEAARNYSLEDKLSFLRDYAGLSMNSTLSPEDASARLEEYISKLYDQIGDVGRYNELVKYIDNYANRLAGKQSEVDRGVEHSLGRSSLNWVNSITGRYGGAKIAYNVSSALNQMSQLPMAAAESGMGNTVRAIRDFMNPRERVDFVARSNYLKTKKGIDWISEPETKWDAFKENGFKMAEIMDSFTSFMAVRSKYNQLMQQPDMTRSEAMRQADEYGRSLMGSRAKGEKPVIFDNKNPFWQVVGKFQLEVMNTWDHVFQDLPNDIKDMAQKEGKTAAAHELAKRVGTYELYAFLLNQATGALYGGSPAPFDIAGNLLESLGEAMGLTGSEAVATILDNVLEAITDERLLGTDDDDDEDKEVDVGAGFGNFMGNVANDVPLVGRFAALAGIGDQTLPMADLSTIWDTGKSIAENGLASAETADKALKAASEFLPGGNQLRKTGQGFMALSQGGVYSGDKLKYPVLRGPRNIATGLTFGRAGMPETEEYYVHRETPLSEKATEAYKAMVSSGVNNVAAYNIIRDVRDAEKTVGKLQAIDRSMLSDQDKLALYMDLVADKDSKKPGQIQQMMKSGMTWKQVTAAYTEYSRLQDMDLRAGEKATEFSHWVDKSGMNSRQKTLTKDAFKFFSMVPGDSERYDSLTAAGLSPDTAQRLAGDLAALEPEGGRKTVTELQKAREILDAGLSEQETVSVLQATMSDHVLEDLSSAWSAGIPTETYVEFWDRTSGITGDKDARGRDIPGYRKKDKVLREIDRLPISGYQKNVLYYASGYKASTLDEAPWIIRGEDTRSSTGTLQMPRLAAPKGPVRRW